VAVDDCSDARRDPYQDARCIVVLPRRLVHDAQPYAATFSGLYYRKDNDGPWQAPQRWVDIRDSISQTTQLNFVSTADIGGGDYFYGRTNTARLSRTGLDQQVCDVGQLVALSLR
jgi:hypothetical protein